MDVPRAEEQPAERVSIDFERGERCGYPEVVYGEGKDVATLTVIFHQMMAAGISVLATRIDQEQADALSASFATAQYNRLARTYRIPTGTESPKCTGRVAIITAGTTDAAIAEEARETLDWMGVDVVMVQDVGVAGPHRLAERFEDFRGAAAVVVVAGMEGALASVVGGYVDCPVVAVPTSVGYGANFGGLAALLSMLNSCAANVTVVNIDAGFRGGFVAGLIARRGKHHDE